MKITVIASYEKVIELEVEDNKDSIADAVCEIDWDAIDYQWNWTIATNEEGDEVYEH